MVTLRDPTSQSPEGSLADFHDKEKEDEFPRSAVSQSPEGSLADFHGARGTDNEATNKSRNPPKGPSPISTRKEVP